LKIGNIFSTSPLEITTILKIQIIFLLFKCNLFSINKMKTNVQYNELKNCIVCDTPNIAESVEHIIPESLGNKTYVMGKGSICDECNNRFSKFENVALNKTVLSFERATLGIPSKSNKTAKGNIQGIEVEGDESFEKDVVKLSNFQNHISNFNQLNNTLELAVPGFNKEAVPVSKLLLKIGIESLYKSRQKIFNRLDLKMLRDFLSKSPENQRDWPFITTDIELDNFRWVPQRQHLNYLIKKIVFSNLLKQKTNVY
jgi:hypothetical protein